MLKTEQTVIVDIQSLPKDIKKSVEEYFAGTDIDIRNDSYQRFPSSCDLKEMAEEYDYKAAKWFIEQGVTSDCVIINYWW